MGDVMKVTTSGMRTEFADRIHRFGEHINSLVRDKQIDILIPLESKGALLIDVACDNHEFPQDLSIIYPRALRYISKERLRASNILIVDDIFYTGKHLRRVYDQVVLYGALEKQLNCVTFLDFSRGTKDEDYDGYMHCMIKNNIVEGAVLERKETLLYLQKVLLERTMPSVYDHLTIQSENVSEDVFFELLRTYSLKNRLLFYGKRGAFLACSVLIDDLFIGDWDVPPKIRMWWHEESEVLRITPVGFTSHGNSSLLNVDIFNELRKVIVGAVKSEKDKDEANYEAMILTARLMQIQVIKSDLLRDVGSFELDSKNIDYYYPDLNVGTIASQYLEATSHNTLSRREEVIKDVGYNKAVTEVLRITKEVWEKQITNLPKDRRSQGYTGSEIFSRLNSFGKVELHAALDYCFDFHFLAAFRRREGGKFSRCYRTTELSRNLLPAEIFGAAIIYSVQKPTPEWLLNKAYPIIKNVNPQCIYGDQLAITKAYFGDITRIKVSEEDHTSWKEVETELWTLEEAGKGFHYKKREDGTADEIVEDIMNDPRLSGFRDTLDAVTFLLEEGGRKAGILLDILTSKAGGAQYICFNLSRLLSTGCKRANEEVLKKHDWHFVGAQEKISLLLSLFEEEDTLLQKLKRRCTKLTRTFNVRNQANKIVDAAKPFQSRLLYDSLSIMHKGIAGASRAARNGNFNGFSEALKSLGIEDVPRATNLQRLLSMYSPILDNRLYAISGQTFPWGYYEQYTLTEGKESFYVLGYDLTGERRKHVAKGQELTRFDHVVHKIIANWIIAFNGKLSTSGINAGDLRFGFFGTIEEAIACSCWMLYHIEELMHTGLLPIGSKAVGAVVTQGSIEVDPVGGASATALDLSGHWLKGKIKQRDLIDAATAVVGRQQYQYSQSQSWLIEHDTFEVNRNRKTMIGDQSTLKHQGDFIKISPIYIDDYFRINGVPWIQHRYS